MSVRAERGLWRVFRDGKEVACFSSIQRLAEYVWAVEEVERRHGKN